MTFEEVIHFIASVAWQGLLNALVCTVIGVAIAIMIGGDRDKQLRNAELISEGLVSCGLFTLYDWARGRWLHKTEDA